MPDTVSTDSESLLGNGSMRREDDTAEQAKSKFAWNFRKKFFKRSPSRKPTGLYEGLLASDSSRNADDTQLGGWLRLGNEAWKRWAAMGIVFYIVLLGDANRGLVLPTLQGYLGIYGGTATELGLANAGFSLGRLVVAPLYGYWMDRRNAGEVILFSMAVCLLSNLLYTYSSLFGNPPVAIVISRSLLGVGASVLGVGRAYIAKQTSKAERGPYIAILCALQYAGFTLTAAISMIDFGDWTELGLTPYNLPGFVLSIGYILGILLLCLVPHSLFEGRKGHVTNTQRPLSTTHYHSPSYPYLLELEKSKETLSNLAKAMEAEATLAESEEPANATDTLIANRPVSRMSSFRRLVSVPRIVIVFILLNFTVRAVLATFETLSTYIISYLYTGSTSAKVWQEMGAPARVSETFTMMGIIGLLVFVGVYFSSKYLADRITLVMGLSLVIIGLAIACDLHDGEGDKHEISLVRYEIGLTFAWALGYPLSQTVVVSALSKVLSQEQQGLWMGNLASAGSAGRIIAPTIAGHVYSISKAHTGLIPLSACLGLSALSLILVMAVWKHLKQTD